MSFAQLEKPGGRFVVSKDSEEGMKRCAIGLAFILDILVEVEALRDVLEHEGLLVEGEQRRECGKGSGDQEQAFHRNQRSQLEVYLRILD